MQGHHTEQATKTTGAAKERLYQVFKRDVELGEALPNAAEAAWIASTREKYGLSQVEAARMCCVTTATWKRWETGKYPMNPCIFHYWLSVLEQRLIPRAGLDGKRWQGWHFRDGLLVTAHGDGLSAAQIESLQDRIKQTRSVYRQIHKVRERVKSGLLEAGESWHGWKFKGATWSARIIEKSHRTNSI